MLPPWLPFLMDARKLAIPEWEGQGSSGQGRTWPHGAFELGPVDILVCLWVLYTFFLKLPSSFFYSWLSRVPWSLLGLARWHRGLLEWASLTQAVGQPLGTVGVSPSPNSLSLSQSSACLLLFPTWTSPPAPSTSTGTGSAPTGPASSEMPCSTGQPSGSGPSPTSGGGCPGQGVGGALGPPGLS